MRRRYYTRIKKKYFIVTGSVLMGVALITTMFLFFISQVNQNTAQANFTLELDQEKHKIIGTGINLSELDSGNLLQDVSFEPFTYRQMMIASGGEKDKVEMKSASNNNQSYPDGFFNGGKLRVMTQVENGLKQKQFTQIKSYTSNHFSKFRPFESGQERESKWYDLADQQHTFIFVGDGGQILRMKDGEKKIVDSTLSSAIISIAASDEGFVAISEKGECIFSEDGNKWEQFAVLQGFKVEKLIATTYPEKQFYAIGGQGQIYRIKNKQVEKQDLFTNQDLKDIVIIQKKIFVGTKEGLVFCSENGEAFKAFNLDLGKDKWQAFSGSGDHLLFMGAEGNLAYLDEKEELTIIEKENSLGRQVIINERAAQASALDPKFINCVMLSNEHWLLISQTGQIYSSRDKGKHFTLNEEEKPNFQVENYYILNSQMIWAQGRDSQWALADLLTIILPDSPLQEKSYKAGDLVFFEINKEEAWVESNKNKTYGMVQIDNKMWNSKGQGEAERVITEGRFDGGEGAILLQSHAENPEAENTFYLTQKIDLTKAMTKDEHVILRLEFYAKQKTGQDATIKAWISDIPEESYGEFSNLQSEWSKYSHVFTLSKTWLKMHPEVYFNIGVEGSDQIYLSKIFLGKIDHYSNEIPAALTQKIDETNPGVIRFDFLDIGKAHVTADTWAKWQGNSSAFITPKGMVNREGNGIAAALKLCKQSMARPWFVFDAYISEPEIAHIFEYLAGDNDTEFGQLRIKQGAVKIWVDSFEKIYIEINDKGNIFPSDQIKAAYVNWVIATIKKNEFYPKFKDKLIFVDGINYQEKLLYSTADFHASDLQIDGFEAEVIDKNILRYQQNIPYKPDITSSDPLELTRKISFQNPLKEEAEVQLAYYLYGLLENLGSHSQLSLLDIPNKQKTAQTLEKYWQTLNIAAKTNQTSLIKMEKNNKKSYQVENHSDQMNTALYGYAYEAEDGFKLIFLNLSNQVQNGKMNNMKDFRATQVAIYNGNGEIFTQNRKKFDLKQITVLPGGVSVVEVAKK